MTWRSRCGPCPAEEHPVELDADAYPREDKIELLRRADQAAREAGPHVVQVMVVHGDSRQELFIANSLGEKVRDSQGAGAHGGAGGRGERRGDPDRARDPRHAGGYELFRRFPPEEAGRIAAAPGLDHAGGEAGPSGPMAAVIANGTGGVLFHEACGHSLEADAVYKQRFRYSWVRSARRWLPP